MWSPWLDDAAPAVLAAHIADPTTTATWRPALAALIRGCALRAEGTPLLALVDPLLAQLDRVEPASR
jgi:hypothetical protein